MTAGLWIVGVLAVLLAALYIRVNQYGAPPVKLLLKTLASLAFVCLGLLGAARAGGAYAWLTWIGLILGAAGDVLLQFMDCRPKDREPFFRAGLGAFLIGHVFYIVAFALLGRVTGWAVLLAAVLFAALFLLQFPARMDLKSQKVPVYAYAAVISVMTAFAVLSFGAGARGALVGLGGILFLVSDAILALIFFSPLREKSLPTWNLITYYAAQILLALSIAVG
ncbi:MAG TPA: lysoplasmalogenase [Candidatus Spyradocola merdavium]|nr:lysoplasmalogenase [Candidatus Spyradocola merdavium]